MDDAALIFDGYGSAGTVTHLPGNPIGTCVWVKNNLLAEAKTIYNVQAKIEYLYNGKLEFVVTAAAWMRGQPPIFFSRLDFHANERQPVPVFIQNNSTLSQPEKTYPQSAFDENLITRPLRPGRWITRLTITADNIAPIVGEVEFTIYQEIVTGPYLIGTMPPLGDVRLPVPTQAPASPAKPNPLKSSWDWVGGRWQWPSLLSTAATVIKFGEYAIGGLLLMLSALAVLSKISHWKAETGSPWPRRTLGYVLLLVGLSVGAILTLRLKGNEPWSHLLTANAPKSATPDQPQKPPITDERPYVWVDKVIAKSPVVGKPLFADVYFVNYGKTPAKDLATFVHIDFGRPADQVCGSFRPDLEQQGAALLGPGKSDVWKTAVSVRDAMAKESFPKNWDGATPIILYGRMFYADFSDNHYTSTFCIEMLNGVTPMFIPGKNDTK
jgi:hypothetical protein